MEQRFTLRHVHAITGTFVLVALGVLIAALVIAGRSQRWFIGNATLRIILPAGGAAGIRHGSEVYFLGTLVGTVSDVTVDPSGRMEAQANIRRDFFLFMRADSSAVVKKQFGMMGDSYFEITRGEGLPLREKNASIICTERLPSALEVAVEEIRHEAVPALEKLSAGLDTWAVLGSNLISSQERLDHLLDRANNLAADLQQGKGTLGRLLADPAAAEEMQALLVKANRSMDEVRVTLAHLQEASVNLRLASTNLPSISHALSKEARELPGLALQSQIAMRELERLIEAMQRHWLLRRYVDRANPPRLRPLVESEEPRKGPAKKLRTPKDTPAPK